MLGVDKISIHIYTVPSGCSDWYVFLYIYIYIYTRIYVYINIYTYILYQCTLQCTLSLCWTYLQSRVPGLEWTWNGELSDPATVRLPSRLQPFPVELRFRRRDTNFYNWGFVTIFVRSVCDSSITRFVSIILDGFNVCQLYCLIVLIEIWCCLHRAKYWTNKHIFHRVLVRWFVKKLIILTNTHKHIYILYVVHMFKPRAY